MPTPQQSHIDRPLTSHSIATMPDMNFISRDAAPAIDVNFKSNDYTVYDKGAFLRTEAKPVPDGAEAPVRDYSTSENSYNTTIEGVKDKIGPVEEDNADPQYNLTMEATEGVTRDLLIKKEVDFYNTFFGSGIWTTETDLNSASEQWDNDSNDPIQQITQDLDTVQALSGRRPNTMIFGPEAYTGFKNNSNVRDVINSVQAVTQANLDNAVADALGIDRIMVGRAIQDTANEGQNSSIDFISASKDALLAYVPDEMGLRTQTAMASFRWNGGSNLNFMDGVRIRQWEDNDTESTFIEGKINYDHQVIGSDLAAYYENCVS